MVKKDFIKKHKPLTKEAVRRKMKEMAEVKKEMTTEAAVLEKNLLEFNRIVDPLIDPETEKVLCWIRRPTQAEWEEMVPAELLEYRNKPEEVPLEVLNKYKDFTFEMMAKLITTPKHDAEWWKAHANLVFQQLFQIHLSGILDELGIAAENF